MSLRDRNLLIIQKFCSYTKLITYRKSGIYLPAILVYCAAILLMVTLAGCPQQSQAIKVEVKSEQEGEVKREDLVELARREGQLTWYTSIPQEQALAFLDLFQKKYPEIKCNLVRESTFDIIQQLTSDIENGRVEADILHVLDVAIFSKLSKNGNLLSYDSPEAVMIDSKYKDGGYWTSMRSVGLFLAVNKKLVPARQIPADWLDLLEPYWYDKIGLKDAQTAGSAYAEYYFLRERYGTYFWEQMAKQRPRIFKTADESLEALQNGEVQVVSGVMDYNDEDEKKYSQILPIWPKNGVPMMLGPVAILKNAPHKNAARLFVDFALSKEGQEVLRDLLGAYSSRNDVDPPKGRPSWSELNPMTPTGGWSEYTQSQDVLRAEYNRLIHPGGE